MASSKTKVFGTFLSVLTIAFLFFLLRGKEFLCVRDNLPSVNADAVVILAGGPDEDILRVNKGVDLFRRRKVSFIIFPLRNTVFTWSWVTKNYRIIAKIPESKIIIGTYDPKDDQLQSDYGGTYLEALKTVALMQQYKMKTAIIVSSCYHMRRVKMAFENARKNHDQKFYYQPVHTIHTSDRPWWFIKEYRRKILREYTKLLAAYFIY